MNKMRERSGWPWVLVLAVVFVAPGVAGELEPPVPPGNPTMKPLNDLEPRHPIYTGMLPLTITEEGSSWYLAEHINTAGAGITIQADGVTLDLNGYQLRGGTGHGITDATLAYEGTVVKNGSIAWWAGKGVSLGPRTVVEDVIVRENGGNGVSVGSDSRVVDCTVTDNAGHGIVVHQGSVVRDNVASDNDENGIWAEYNGTGYGSLITRNAVEGNGKNGIRLDGWSTVSDNDVKMNGRLETKAGIWVMGDQCRIEGNHITQTPVGIDLDGWYNVIVRNTFAGNNTHIHIAATASGNLVPTFVVGTPGDPLAWDNVCIGSCP